MSTTPRHTTVLLPIDFQRAFDDPPWPRRWNQDTDPNARRLLAMAREHGMPILHVRHDSKGTGSSLHPGTPGHRFRDGFEPEPGEPIVSKSVNSAFIGTDLDLQLRRLSAERVLAFGYSTDMCVSTTIRHGANLGWDITLVEDACDCFELANTDGTHLDAKTIHDAHVATLAYEFCDVTSTDALIADFDC